MINPVADQCEANGVPCLSTLAPWQPYFLGRGGDPATGFDWTYHFFWGADQLVGVFVEMWDSVQTNKKIGLLCANDPDGNALADPKTGFPAGARRPDTRSSIRAVSSRSRTTSRASSVSSRPKASRSSSASRCRPTSPRSGRRRKQQDFHPKLVTMAKAVLFPSAVEALGDLGDGLASEIWWTPSHPFSSSLTGETPQELSDQYEQSTGKQWTQFVGFVHALFEADLRRPAPAPARPTSRPSPMPRRQPFDTIVGPLRFGAGGVPKNVCNDVARRRPVAEDQRRGLRVRSCRDQQQAVAGDPAHGRTAPTGLSRPRRMTALLEVVGVSKRSAASRSIEDVHVPRCRGRSPRHRGTERRRQDHAAEPRRGRPSPRRGHVRLRRRRHHPAPRPCALPRGIGRTAQIPRPFEGLTVFENVLVGATFGAAGAPARHCRRRRGRGARARRGSSTRRTSLAGR